MSIAVILEGASKNNFLESYQTKLRGKIFEEHLWKSCQKRTFRCYLSRILSASTAIQMQLLEVFYKKGLLLKLCKT